MAPASVKQVVDYFGMKLSEFKKEWEKMTETDKEQLKKGIGDGTLTY